MSKKIAQEIFEEIRKKNEKTGNDSIPHSDDFIHFLNISTGIEPDLARKLVKVLINAHKIFAIEIASEDKKNGNPRIEGYVECDLKTIRRLKLFFQDELIRQYETEHYRRVTYHQLIKEIIPIMNTLNNTPMGQVANKAIMMGELERLMEKNFEDFTEDWKERFFEIEISKLVSANSADKAPSGTESNNNRVNFAQTDKGKNKTENTKNYSDLISKTKNYPLDRILKIYGVDFFLKAQIRRREFSYLTSLVETGKFLTNANLLSLKEMLYMIKKDIANDPQLAELRDEIYGLERSITHKLYFGNDAQAN